MRQNQWKRNKYFIWSSLCLFLRNVYVQDYEENFCLNSDILETAMLTKRRWNISLRHLRSTKRFLLFGDISHLPNLKMRSFSHHLDADECTLNSHDCDANANCKNTPGSFTCECDHNSHYYGNGKTCYANRKFHNCSVNDFWDERQPLGLGFEPFRGPSLESPGNLTGP